jgi:hypothetical protein
MEWELDSIPRSYFLEAGFPASLRFLAFVLFRMKGRGHFFYACRTAPRNRALSLPKEVLRACYRIARSMQLQPEIRALPAHAWFPDPAAVKDYPNLEVLNQPYFKEGGLIVLLGPAGCGNTAGGCSS